MGKRGRQLSFWLISFLFLWLAFSLAASRYFDPDFGWHFRTGEWIWEHRTVPQTDLFSYSMPDYPWRAYAWLADVFIYRAYPWFHYSGLAVFFSFWAALAFIIWLPPKKIAFSFAPLLLAGLAALDYAGVRPKTISFFLGAVVFGLLRKTYQNNKWFLSLPLFFLIWPNLHGGYGLGLMIFFLMLASDLYLIFLKKEKLGRHFFWGSAALIVSGGLTFFNPYGWTIYHFLYEEMILGQQAHFLISEWRPYTSFNLGMLFLTAGFLALVKLFPKKLTFFEKATAGLLLLNGLWTRRMIIYFFLFVLPLLTELLEASYLVLKKQPKFIALWKHKRKILAVFLVFIGFAGTLHLTKEETAIEDRYYPRQAVDYLQRQELAGNLFSVYNWGGYLIWKWPEKKVFIDGRMNVWRQDGYAAFEEEEQILRNAIDYRPVFEKHQVQAVLLPLEKKKKPNLNAYLNQKFKKDSRENIALNQRLAADHWQLAYQDGIAQIFLKPENKEN